ncbi:MAG: hypothetical protein RI940_19 [Bacteroidota bacterium]|jgi:hypothetical protein
MKSKQIYYPLLFIILVITFSCNKSIESLDITNNPTTPTTITTKYPLVLSPNNLLVSIQVPSTTFSFANQSYYGIFSSVDSVKVFSDIIYQRFKDNFDFIFIITNNATHLSNQPYGVNFGVSNSVKGTGAAIFQNEWGSTSAKLKSFMFLPYKDAITNGPTLHEICHNWANFTPKGIFKTIDANQASLPEIDALDGHWGVASTNGQLGGFDLATLKTLTDVPNHYHAQAGSNSSFGLFANGGNSIAYSPIELYMMGLASKSEVPDITVFSGITVDGNDFFNNGNFFATTKKTLSLDQIITQSGIGERVPDYQSSQKEFRAIVVVVSPTALTSAEWTSYEKSITDFFKKSNDETSLFNFYEATKGRGWIKTDQLNLEAK